MAVQGHSQRPADPQAEHPEGIQKSGYENRDQTVCPRTHAQAQLCNPLAGSQMPAPRHPSGSWGTNRSRARCATLTLRHGLSRKLSIRLTPLCNHPPAGGAGCPVERIERDARVGACGFSSIQLGAKHLKTRRSGATGIFFQAK